MPYTTIQGNASDVDENLADFAGTVTSVDNFSVTSIGENRIVALVEYTA